MENNDLDIPTKESSPAFDAREFEGTRIKIADVNKIQYQSHWIDGNYDKDKSVSVDAIEIVTEPVTEIDSTDGKVSITAKARFNLSKDEEGNVFISKHPKANLWKFMRKMGVEKVSELKGKIVTLTAVASTNEDDDRYWLRIVQ